jgi:hypothetical protein
MYAVAKASAFTCADHLYKIVEVEDCAAAFAKAVAIAVSQIYASCFVDGKGFACASADTYIEQTARATATAFAQLWAEAIVCDSCHVTIDAFVSACSEVVVTAATQAHGSLCVSGAAAPLQHTTPTRDACASWHIYVKQSAYPCFVILLACLFHLNFVKKALFSF